MMAPGSGKSRIAGLFACFYVCSAAAAFAPSSHVGNPSSLTSPKTPLSFNNRNQAPMAWTPRTQPSSTSRFMGMWSGEDELRGSDRLKACVPYMLPILDGDQFGRYIYERIPPLGLLDDIILGPVLNVYHSVPFIGLILFVFLTLGTRGNTNMSRGVRFNAQQAALIDVGLIFPELIGSSLVGVDVPRYLSEPCSNFVYYAYIAAVGYSIVSNLQGKKPDKIPWISGNAEMMTGLM